MEEKYEKYDVEYNGSKYRAVTSGTDISYTQNRPKGELVIDSILYGFEQPLYLVVDHVKEQFGFLYQANPDFKEGLGVFFSVEPESDVFKEALEVINALQELYGEKEKE